MLLALRVIVILMHGCKCLRIFYIELVGKGYPWLGLVWKRTCLGTGLELLVLYGGIDWELLGMDRNGWE